MTSEKPREEAKDPEFKVVDRRRFSAEGESKTAGEKPENAQAITQAAQSELVGKNFDKSVEKNKDVAPESGQRQSQTSLNQGVPPLDFSSFVVSLATQGFVMLGEMPNPETGLLAVNLEAARQTVDILGILEQKTKGNLSAEEQRLLSEILASLRLAFVNKVGAR